ncbi:MAG: hypothetical protein Fur0018_14690 [Anaerolineales bacterium]
MKDLSLPVCGEIVESVCGGPMEFTPDTPFVEHEGRMLYFCLPACKATFLKYPQAFLSGDIPHFEAA